MAASSHAAFLGPGLLSLATGPRRAANRPAPRPAKAAPAQPVTREVVAQPEAAVPGLSRVPPAQASSQVRAR